MWRPTVVNILYTFCMRVSVLALNSCPCSPVLWQYAFNPLLTLSSILYFLLSKEGKFCLHKQWQRCRQSIGIQTSQDWVQNTYYNIIITFIVSDQLKGMSKKDTFSVGMLIIAYRCGIQISFYNIFNINNNDGLIGQNSFGEECFLSLV